MVLRHNEPELVPINKYQLLAQYLLFAAGWGAARGDNPLVADQDFINADDMIKTPAYNGERWGHAVTAATGKHKPTCRVVRYTDYIVGRAAGIASLGMDLEKVSTDEECKAASQPDGDPANPLRLAGMSMAQAANIANAVLDQAVTGKCCNHD